MKFYLLSDNIDTQMGMRLAGIEGKVVHTPTEVSEALDEAMELPDVGIILMTELALKQCPEKVMEYKLNRPSPLLGEKPDKHAKANIADSIAKNLAEADDIKL